MTEAERQQVIDALEWAQWDCKSSSPRLPRIVAALAIMRRENRATQAGDIPDFGHPVGLPPP